MTARRIPVEAFVHDAETLAWFVEADMLRGRPSILNMVVEGIVIGSARGCAEALQKSLGARLRDGPPRMEPGQLNVLRYEITDAIDDLRGERSPAEILAIGAMLHPKLVELALRGRQRWNGTGKWAPRLLAATDPELADRFDRAFRELFASVSCQSVIALAEQEMGPHGGGCSTEIAGTRLGRRGRRPGHDRRRRPRLRGKAIPRGQTRRAAACRTLQIAAAPAFV